MLCSPPHKSINGHKVLIFPPLDASFLLESHHVEANLTFTNEDFDLSVLIIFKISLFIDNVISRKLIGNSLIIRSLKKKILLFHLQVGKLFCVPDKKLRFLIKQINRCCLFSLVFSCM